jgi:hypothetical protein
MPKQLIEIDVEQLGETDKAYLVTHDGKARIWVAKCQLEDWVEDDGKVTRIIVEEWLAIRKGFV